MITLQIMPQKLLPVFARHSPLVQNLKKLRFSSTEKPRSAELSSGLDAAVSIIFPNDPPNILLRHVCDGYMT